MKSLNLTGWETVGVVTIGIVVVLLILFIWIVVRKGRPFAPGDVFRASRLSKGNHLLPTQVLISQSTVVHHTPQWIGKYEHSINMAHISSVGIDTHMMFSDVYIESSGGAAPIRCEGHHKADAVKMKQLIEQYQTAYFSSGGARPDMPPVPKAAPSPAAPKS
jgi:hypothetical protein